MNQRHRPHTQFIFILWFIIAIYFQSLLYIYIHKIILFYVSFFLSPLHSPLHYNTEQSKRARDTHLQMYTCDSHLHTERPIHKTRKTPQYMHGYIFERNKSQIVMY